MTLENNPTPSSNNGAPEAAVESSTVSRRRVLALGWVAPVVLATPLTGWADNHSLPATSDTQTGSADQDRSSTGSSTGFPEWTNSSLEQYAREQQNRNGNGPLGEIFRGLFK